MDAVIQERVNAWVNGNYDQVTKEAIANMQANNQDELADAFYKSLEFGTGGLRGIMGVGTNRINKYTIGMATQGFANYLKKTYPSETIKMAIGHDSRNNSRFFAETTANVFAANGIKVYLFEALRPTPELSFAIRHLGCKGGVVCTASHNPKEYNGYKAYWNDGGQLVPPHDKNVIKEVEAVTSIDDVKWTGGEMHISIMGKEMDDAYLKMVKGLSVYPEVIAKQHDLKIVYTPIHGTGITLVPQVLKDFGFTNVTVVEEQSVPDGNFPTVVYPNPEESETMSIGLSKAKALDADILLGTDPDADRVGIGVKNHKGEWVLMNGNQTAVLAFAYMLEARKAKGIAQPNDMVITTIVTTEMINALAAANDVACYNVLTGFKWIAELIKEKEQQEKLLLQYHKQILRQQTSLILRLKQILQSRKKNPYILSPYLLLSKKLQQIDDSKLRLFAYGQTFLKQKKTELMSLEKQKKLLEPSYQIRQWKEKYSVLQKRLDQSWQQMATLRQKLLDSSGKKRKLDLSLQQNLQKQKQNLSTLISHLQSIDPKNLLTKGYCILFSENKNSVILSTKEVTPEQTLRIRMKDGQIKAKVEEIL